MVKKIYIKPSVKVIEVGGTSLLTESKEVPINENPNYDPWA